MRIVSVARIAGASVLAGTLILGGCGYKNRPAPPENVVPKAIEDLRYNVDESGATLTWTYPVKTIAGTDIQSIDSFELYRAVVSLEDYCATCPVPFGDPIEVEGGVTSFEGETVRVASYQTALLRPGNRYFFKVRARTSWWADSDDSNVVSFIWQIPAKAPEGVAVTPESDHIALSWEPVTTLIDDTEIENDVSYQVFRSDAGTEFTPVGEPILENSYIDSDIAVGQKYFYKVQSLIFFKSNKIGGGVSEIVDATPQDIEPPTIPTGVEVIASASGNKILWNPSEEDDLAAYNIYRSIGSKDNMELLGTVQGFLTVFDDKDVPEGKRVYYSLSAVDKAIPPNESEKSESATTRD